MYIIKSSTMKIWVMIAFFVCMIPGIAGATGLQPGDTNTPVFIKKVSFYIDIKGMYVSGMIEASFRAETGTANEGVFRFPLPPGAVLYNAEIFLPGEDRWEAAETIGRKEGEEVYQEVIRPRPRRDPLLIQEVGKDLYRARVYPISSAQDYVIRVYYAHILEPEDTGCLLRIAFYNQDSNASIPGEGVSISVNAAPGFWREAQVSGVDDEYLDSMEIDLDAGTADISLSGFRMAYDILVKLTPSEGTVTKTGLLYIPQTEVLDKHMHLWWVPDLSDYPSVETQPRSVVFVIDISGSMEGEKIIQAREGIISCIQNLLYEDWFGVAAFAHTVYEYENEMISAGYPEDAINWVLDLSSGGGTALSAGLVKGVEIGMSSPLDTIYIDLFLISDGLPNVGSDTTEEILQDVADAAAGTGKTVRIFGVGIGVDLDQSFLSALTFETGGEAVFALDDSEIKGYITDLFSRVKGGGVSDVHLEVSGTGISDTETFEWARIFPGTGLNLGAAGNITGTIDLLLTGITSNGNTIQVSDRLSHYTQGSDGIHLIAPCLAAKTWADGLERLIDQEGESQELVTAAVKLAKKYGIVTRYSSKLALENESMYTQNGIQIIDRDPAGIALEEVDRSVEVESRIGGTNAWDSGGSTSGGNTGSTSTWNTPESGPRSGGCLFNTANSPLHLLTGFLLFLITILIGKRMRRTSIKTCSDEKRG